MRDLFEREMTAALDRQIKAIEERQGYPIPAPPAGSMIWPEQVKKKLAEAAGIYSPAASPKFVPKFVTFIDGPLHEQIRPLTKDNNYINLVMLYVEKSSLVLVDEVSSPEEAPGMEIRKAKYQRMYTPMADGSIAYYYMGEEK